MDLEFSPSILETPSLMTPNINNNNPLIFKSSYITTIADVKNENNGLSSNSSLTTTTDESLPVTSADIKLSKIEHDLKQSFVHPRQPTESPFRRMAETVVPSTADDGLPVEIPSTADVMNVLESFSKNLTKDNNEREITTNIPSDIPRPDSSPTHNTMGVNVSPKKHFLIRSQSQTEPTSPPTNDESSNEEHQFQRLHDLPLNTHTMDSMAQVEHPIKPTYSIQLRTDPTLIKQQTTIIPTNKRTYQQINLGTAIPKSNAVLIPQHEVTSTGQMLGMKRAKTAPIPTNNNINIRSSTNEDHLGNDDQRKKQIRDSNREAARRCRERRRQYIEQLEGNLEQCKLQMKQLNEKLTRAERENTQLRAILTEAKIFHTSSRLSSNEAMMDFATVLANNNGTDLNSEMIDGNTMSRNFLTRNTH